VLSVRGWLAAIGFMLLMAFAFFVLSEPYRDPVALGGLVGGIACVGFSTYANLTGLGMRRREIEAGYTTLFGMAYDCWQLDPRTGEVRRHPGERPVTRPARHGDRH
jgi:hypothetical protein